MSDIVGAKAIALVQAGGIVEKPYARTFVVPGKGYEVTFGTRPVGAVPRYSCTCPATGRCYHGEAAALLMAKQRERVRASATVADARSAVVSAFDDSAAMRGNEEHFAGVLAEFEAAVRQEAGGAGGEEG